MKLIKMAYTKWEGRTTFYTETEYKNLMQSTEEQEKGDVVEVDATPQNLVIVLSTVLYVEYNLDAAKLTDAQLITWGTKLGYLF